MLNVWCFEKKSDRTVIVLQQKLSQKCVEYSLLYEVYREKATFARRFGFYKKIQQTHEVSKN